MSKYYWQNLEGLEVLLRFCFLMFVGYLQIVTRCLELVSLKSPSIFSGGLHTSEPWIIKQHEWSYYLPNVDGVFLECIDKNITKFDLNEICENDATYFGGRNDYYCNCTKGWTGKKCSEPSKIFFNESICFAHKKILMIPKDS